MNSPRALSVSFVIPVLNEERHVEAAVRSVVKQEGLDQREIILVLGESTDSTPDIVERLVGEFPEIVAIPNPTSAISAGMNLGARAATLPYLIRLDAHTILPPRYAARACQALRRTGAVNVGGRMRAEGTTSFEDAVAWIYNSRVGLGGAVYHVGGDAGPAESAYLGVFDREQFLAAGGFDETLSRGKTGSSITVCGCAVAWCGSSPLSRSCTGRARRCARLSSRSTGRVDGAAPHAATPARDAVPVLRTAGPCRESCSRPRERHRRAGDVGSRALRVRRVGDRPSRDVCAVGRGSRRRRPTTLGLRAVLARRDVADRAHYVGGGVPVRFCVRRPRSERLLRPLRRESSGAE